MTFNFPKILLLSSFFLLSFQLFSQSAFQKVIGGKSSEEFKSIEMTTDNNFIVLGNTTSFGNGDMDIFIANIDHSGNIIWAKAIGGPFEDNAQHLLVTKDGNYIITGYTRNSGNQDYDAFMIKIDPSCNIIWSKIFSTSKDDYFAESVEYTNGYMIVGSTKALSNPYTDALIVNTDKFGNMNWAKSFGEPSNDLLANIIPSSDGNFIASGSYSEGDVEHYNCKAMKFDAGGSVFWYNIFAASLFEVARSITLSNDGGYIISGTTNSYNSSDNDFLVYKINENGSLAWSKVYGGNKDEKSQSIININSDAYLITGFTDSYGFGSRDVMALKIDNSGSIIWSKTYGGVDWDGNYSITSNYKVRAAVFLKNDGFLIGDQTKGFQENSGDIFIIHSDTLGNSNDCNYKDIKPYTYNFPLNVLIGNPAIKDVSLSFAALNFVAVNINPHDSNVCKCFINVNLGKDTSFCKGSSVMLDSKIENAKYLWNNNSTNKILAADQSEKYSVTVTDKNGCTGIDSVTVSENPLPIVELGNDTTICPNQNITFNAANPGDSYLWSNSSQSQKLTVSKAGKYIVTVTDNNNCSASDSVQLFLYPVTVLDLGKERGFCNGNIINLDAGYGFISYLWQDGSLFSSYTVTEPGKYWVYAVDQNQCAYSDTVNVIDTCGYHIFIPNAFTPDSDFKNDSFACKGFGIVSFKMQVFNRWGALIFTSDDINKGWDGTYNNSPCPNDIYVYVVNFKAYSRKRYFIERRTGKVTLFR